MLFYLALVVGVFLVLFGLYEKLVDAIINFFKSFKKNLNFLFPLALGLLTGVFMFGNVLMFLFNSFPIQTNFAFMGFILGGIPALFKKIDNKNIFRLKDFIFLLLALFISISLIFLEKSLNFDISIVNDNFFFLIFAGFCMSIGIVVPGISSSVILMLLNVYTLYLNSIATINFSILIPLGIGLIIGGFIFLKIINFLFKHYCIKTYYIIIGFVISSLFVLFPEFYLNINYIISIFIFIFCTYISYLSSKKAK